MASYKAADTYITEFATQRFDTGTATDADILPTATASLNGVTDGSFSLTVANITTGHYKITGTIPSYSSGDVINITVVATVNSVVGKEVIDTFVIDSKRNSDLNDFDPLNDIVANVTLVDTTTDVSNGVTLANDAITSAKYDESTAFPIKSADTGITQIARTGADGDTLETLSDQSDVINAKTTNLPASPAAVGSEMNLANDSITSAKYDESTAFPIKSVDTGSTQIARTGADADTLETLSDQVDATSTHTPANVVASLFSATPTAGGVTTFEEITNILYSMARGKIIRSNNEYAFYDDDDVTLLFTMTVAAGSRTVS